MKRKQVIVLGLVMVIIAVGILQYYSGGTGEIDRTALINGGFADSDSPLDEIPGAAVYVNGTNNPDTGANTDTDAVKPEDVKITGYFAEARLERDRVRSRQKEELKSLTESSDPANPASLDAQEKLVDVIKRSEVETTVETLIKQRGFEDALVYMSDTGNIDVIVKASSLSSKEVAHISDIVTRHSKVAMEYITVRNSD